jgi:hypothetical protein
MKSRIPRNVWVLGFVSLLTDVSSEMIHSVLPLFLVTTLGASLPSAEIGCGPVAIDGVRLAAVSGGRTTN